MRSAFFDFYTISEVTVLSLNVNTASVTVKEKKPDDYATVVY